jgi:hypothetical protein
MPVPGFAHGVTDSNYWFAHLDSMSASTKTAAAKTDAIQTATKTASTDSGESFFDDLLDIVNPLQHLPVVSTIYRSVTGDKIGDVEKVAGDTLYGGTIGLISSLADVAFEKITGKDFGDTVMTALGLEGNDGNTALASNASKQGPDKTAAANKPELKGQPLIVASAAPIPLVKSPELTAAANKASPAADTQPSKQAQAATAADVAAKSATPVNISPDTDALLQALARNGVTGQLQSQALDAYRRTMQMNSGVPAAN